MVMELPAALARDLGEVAAPGEEAEAGLGAAALRHALHGDAPQPRGDGALPVIISHLEGGYQYQWRSLDRPHFTSWSSYLR